MDTKNDHNTKKIEIDFSKESKFESLTKKLEQEKIIKVDDVTYGDMKIINNEEDMKDFDYFEQEKTTSINTEELENVQTETLEIDQVDDQKLEEEEIKIEKFEINDELLVNSNFNKRGKPIISFKDVHLKIEKDNIINGISLDIYKGEFVYLVGPSGAGKSSLAKMVYREIKNTQGDIYIDDVNITTIKSRNLPKLRRKLGVIFQDYKLLQDKTIYDNVKYSLDVTGYPKKERKEQVLRTLKKVGLIKYKDKYPSELSGGQQQRVSIARAIVANPIILVADEPTGNLDPHNAMAIMEILMKIKETGTTIIMATHDVGIVNKYQNRVVLLKDGLLQNESEGKYIYD